MAVLTYSSDQLAEDYRGRPTNDHGKLRVQYFKATTAAVGDATSTFNLCLLPAGQVRVLPKLSYISVSALGASRVMDIGHRAYTKAGDGASATDEAEDLDAFTANLDVSSAVTGVALSSSIKFDIYSKRGVVVCAEVAGGTVPSGAVVEGYITYVYE